MALVSPRALQAFREHFVDDGVLRTIEDAFAVQGIRPKRGSAEEVGGQRRQLVEECYRSLDLSEMREGPLEVLHPLRALEARPPHAQIELVGPHPAV